MPQHQITKYNHILSMQLKEIIFNNHGDKGSGMT